MKEEAWGLRRSESTLPVSISKLTAAVALHNGANRAFVRLYSGFNPSSSFSPARGLYRHLPPSPTFTPESSKRSSIPSAHPNLPPADPNPQISPSVASRSPSVIIFSSVPFHSRLLSQPTFFNLDSLATGEDRMTASSSAPAPAPLALVKSSSGRVPGDGLPPHKVHRRLQSDIPFGFFQSNLPMAGMPPPPLVL